MQEDNRAVQVRVRACGSPFRIGPIRILADLEDMTSVWAAWYNTSNHAPVSAEPNPPGLQLDLAYFPARAMAYDRQSWRSIESNTWLVTSFASSN